MPEKIYPELYQTARKIYPTLDRDSLRLIVEEVAEGGDWDEADIRFAKKKIFG